MPEEMVLLVVAKREKRWIYGGGERIWQLNEDAILADGAELAGHHQIWMNREKFL